MITWLDVGKLIIPFVFSLILLWIKGRYDQHTQKTVKQEALFRVLSDDVNHLSKAIKKLQLMSEAANEGKVIFVSFVIPTVITELALDLSKVDPKNAYQYSDLIASIEIVNKGLSKLADFVKERVKINDDHLTERLNRAIKVQSEIIEEDFKEFGASFKRMIRSIFSKNRTIDQQTLDDITKKIDDILDHDQD